MTIKCDKCNGDGFVLDENGEAHDCDKCYSCGYLDVETNEEWLRQASTEELAEELLEHFMWGTTVNAEECFTKEYISRIKKHIMEWLKEVHNDGKH